MKALILLADAAQAVGGKLYVLGGGWSITSPGIAFALAIKLEIPWSRANERHDVAVELLDEDGQPFRVPTPDGEQELIFRQQIETGRPAGLPHGMPIDSTWAINLGGLPLVPGKRYTWRVTVNGETDEAWQAGFWTRPDPNAGAGPAA